MINLLPPELREARMYGRRNVGLFGYSLSLLATAVLTASIMIASLQFVGSEEPKLRERLAANQTTVAALEQEIKSIEGIATRLETAVKVDEQSVNFSELIPKIGAVLPEGVVLNALSLTGGKTDPLQLDVDLLEASLAPVLIRNLVESDLFEAADISSLSPKGAGTEDAGADTYQFNAAITASFTGTAEAAKKKAAAEAAQKRAAEEAAAAQGTTQSGGAQ